MLGSLGLEIHDVIPQSFEVHKELREVLGLLWLLLGKIGLALLGCPSYFLLAFTLPVVATAERVDDRWRSRTRN